MFFFILNILKLFIYFFKKIIFDIIKSKQPKNIKKIKKLWEECFWYYDIFCNCNLKNYI
jgi:hypothetical protein